MPRSCFSVLFFFFNDTATTEIYTLSLHERSSDLPGAMPRGQWPNRANRKCGSGACPSSTSPATDRKSTRLNSSHGYISYAVFCLKKKNHETEEIQPMIYNQSPQTLSNSGAGLVIG